MQSNVTCESEVVKVKHEKSSWLLSLKRSLAGKKKLASNLTPSRSGPTLAVAGRAPLSRRLNKSDWDLGEDRKIWSESVPCLDLAQLSLEDSGPVGEGVLESIGM